MAIELTRKQKNQRKIYADKWQAIFSSLDRANRTEAEKGIHLAYQLAGYKPPEQIIWYESPYAMHTCDYVLQNIDDYPRSAFDYYDIMDYIKHIGWHIDVEIENKVQSAIKRVFGSSVWDGLERYFDKRVNPPQHGWGIVDGAIRSALGIAYKEGILEASLPYSPTGSHDARRYVKYDYCQDVLGLERQTKRLAGVMQVALHAGWWLPYEDRCFVSERPTAVHFDEKGRLHNDNGAAITFGDGWGVYAIRGTNVPDYVVLQPEQITPDKILHQLYLEVAQIMTRRYGVRNFIRDGGFKVYHTDEYGDLYYIHGRESWDPIDPYRMAILYTKDAGTYSQSFFYVPNYKTAQKATAWLLKSKNPDDFRADQKDIP